MLRVNASLSSVQDKITQQLRNCWVPWTHPLSRKAIWLVESNYQFLVNCRDWRTSDAIFHQTNRPITIENLHPYKNYIFGNFDCDWSFTFSFACHSALSENDGDYRVLFQRNVLGRWPDDLSGSTKGSRKVRKSGERNGLERRGARPEVPW